MTKYTHAAAITGLTLALGLSLSAPAEAAATFQSCVNTAADAGDDYDISGKVSPTLTGGCTILTPLSGGGSGQNDSPQPGYVNTAEFFGPNDWSYDGKWEEKKNDEGVVIGWGESKESTFFNFTGGAQSGTFTLMNTPTVGTEVMFIFKDGNDTSLVGYLIDIAALIADVTDPARTGTYSSPFTDPPFSFSGNGPRDISHISVYYRAGTPSSNGGTPGSGGVPEPGTLSLLGLAMLGGVFYSRRRRIAAH